MSVITSHPITPPNRVKRGYRGEISKASQYQQVIHQITCLLTLNQNVYSL